jgi:hypothetical protein
MLLQMYVIATITRMIVHPDMMSESLSLMFIIASCPCFVDASKKGTSDRAYAFAALPLVPSAAVMEWG